MSKDRGRSAGVQASLWEGHRSCGKSSSSLFNILISRLPAYIQWRENPFPFALPCPGLSFNLCSKLPALFLPQKKKEKQKEAFTALVIPWPPNCRLCHCVCRRFDIKLPTRKTLCSSDVRRPLCLSVYERNHQALSQTLFHRLIEGSVSQ